MAKFKAEAVTSSHTGKHTFVVRNHTDGDSVVIVTADGAFIWLRLSYKNAAKLALGLQTLLENK